MTYENASKKRFLTENEIDLMAEAGAASYEMTADKSAAWIAIVDFAADDLSCHATRAQVNTAFNRAMTIWQGVAIATKKQIEANQ